MRERPQRKGRPRERPSYFAWQDGKPPDVMWEFGAPLTVKGDAEKKKATYRGMGVREYWLVDPVGGVYEPMPCEEAPDGMVTVWSPLLQLEVRFANRRLRFWDRETAQYLELPEDEVEGWVQRDAEARRAAEARAEKAELDLEAEERARKALEERIAKFEAESRSTRDST